MTEENATTAWRLSDEERCQYESEGFFARASVFSEADLEGLRAAAERVVASAEAEAARIAELPEVDGGGSAESTDYEIDGNRYVEGETSTIQFEHRAGSKTVRVIEPFVHRDPTFEKLVADPRLIRPLCGVLGEERIALWTDKLNLKRPFEGSGFRWHQDSPYWSHVSSHCDRLPNVMITLDDADRGNGCFRLIPGSHRDGFLPGIDDGSRLGPLFTDPAHFDEGAEWLAELPAGSLVVFSAHTVHGSQPNRSDRARRAVVLTYQPPDHAMFKRPGTWNFSD